MINTTSNANNANPNQNARPKRPFDFSDNKGRGYGFLWAVYPDYWKQSWGQRPLLGYVRADSEFHARYAAFDKGLLPRNDTFEPRFVLQTRTYSK